MPKTKAQTSFEAKLKFLLREDRLEGPALDAEAGGPFRLVPQRPSRLDIAAVARLFSQYGAYLELVGDDKPVGRVVGVQFPPEPPRPAVELAKKAAATVREAGEAEEPASGLVIAAPEATAAAPDGD